LQNKIKHCISLGAAEYDLGTEATFRLLQQGTKGRLLPTLSYSCKLKLSIIFKKECTSISLRATEYDLGTETTFKLLQQGIKGRLLLASAALTNF